jgi:hypothetical protein
MNEFVPYDGPDWVHVVLAVGSLYVGLRIRNGSSANTRKRSSSSWRMTLKPTLSLLWRKTMKPDVKISLNDSPFAFYGPDPDGVIRIEREIPVNDLKVWAAYQIFDDRGRGVDSGLGRVFTDIWPSITHSQIPVMQYGGNGGAPGMRLLVGQIPVDKPRTFITNVYFPGQKDDMQRVEITITRKPGLVPIVPEPNPAPAPGPDKTPEENFVDNLERKLKIMTASRDDWRSTAVGFRNSILRVRTQLDTILKVKQ